MKKIKNKAPEKIRPPVFTKSIKEEFLRFMEYHPASRVSRNVRNMMLQFLMYPGGTEANYLQDLLYDLEGLFQLLDTIESQTTGAEPEGQWLPDGSFRRIKRMSP